MYYVVLYWTFCGLWHWYSTYSTNVTYQMRDSLCGSVSCQPKSNSDAALVMLSWKIKVHRCKRCFDLQINSLIFFLSTLKKLRLLSFSFSIPRPITCFHSTTKNLALLCSVSLFQSQGPLHVFIVQQKNLTSLHLVSVFQS